MCEEVVAPMTHGFLFQVHTACKESLLTKCPLGLCKVSVIPPTALNSIDSDGGCPQSLSLLMSICPFSALPHTNSSAVLETLRCGQ